jgi:hypothetical protein
VNTAFPNDASLPTPPTPPAYRDSSGGLLAFGIVQIVVGGLISLGIPLMLLGALLARRVGGGMPLGGYAISVVTYGFAAVLLITLGVGSIRGRRWARALTLVLSWAWLFVGIMMTVFLTAVLPATFVAAFHKAAALNPNARAMPAGVLALILTFIIVLFSVFLVVLPLAFLLFYRKKDVEQTVNQRGPEERWTDRCPLPVLAASLFFAWGCPYYLLMSFTTPLIPFFGRYLTGPPGAIGCWLVAALDAYLAYSLFHLQSAGWWISTATLTLRTASAVITYARGDLLQAYSRMGWKATQLQMMSESPMFRSHLFLWWSVGFLLAFLGYMFGIKRYFRLPPDPTVAGAVPSIT